MLSIDTLCLGSYNITRRRPKQTDAPLPHQSVQLALSGENILCSCRHSLHICSSLCILPVLRSVCFESRWRSTDRTTTLKCWKRVCCERLVCGIKNPRPPLPKLEMLVSSGGRWERERCTVFVLVCHKSLLLKFTE